MQSYTLLTLCRNQVNKTDGHLNEDGQVDKCFLDYEHKALSESVDNEVHPNQDTKNFTVCDYVAKRCVCV